jgi:hypothetical protein
VTYEVVVESFKVEREAVVEHRQGLAYRYGYDPTIVRDLPKRLQLTNHKPIMKGGEELLDEYHFWGFRRGYHDPNWSVEETLWESPWNVNIVISIAEKVKWTRS